MSDIFDLLKNEEYLNSLIEKYWFITDEIKNEDIYYSLEGYSENAVCLEKTDSSFEVYFAEKNQKWERIPVELGISDGVYVVVKSGVKKDDILRGIQR